jgi:hypothetical protein
MMDHNGTKGPNGHAEDVGVDVTCLLIDNGYRRVTDAWVKLGDEPDEPCKKDTDKREAHGQSKQKDAAHDKEAPSTEEALSPEDEKRRQWRKDKRAQRKADKSKGWVQCSVKVWDDPDARKLISAVASGTREVDFRAAIWLAVKDPYIVGLGARVSRLTGMRRFIMRSIIGPF